MSRTPALPCLVHTVFERGGGVGSLYTARDGHVFQLRSLHRSAERCDTEATPLCEILVRHKNTHALLATRSYLVSGVPSE